MNVESNLVDLAAVPLAVDVDGTLLRTDLLHEAALQFIAKHPLQAPRLLLWLLRGRAHLKTQLGSRISPPVSTMPLRDETVNLIRAAQAAGRPVYLASASDERYVRSLADRIGGIAGVFGTTANANLAGSAKAQRLNDEFGERGYDYVGDRAVDIAVWRSSRLQYVVAHDAALEKQVNRVFDDVRVIARPRVKPASYVKTLRTHQWSKNILLFLGVIAGHHFELEAIGTTLAAFVCFCAAASSAYIINDLLDLPGDRSHPSKRKRPLASGDLPISHAVALAILLMVFSLGVASLLPLQFIGVLAAYVVSTLAYSMWLKRKAIVDVIVLGGLYTIRVYAGLAAISATGSEWLLIFSLFLFLCLAIEKRCSELVRRRETGEDRLDGRNYRVEDLAMLMPLAAAAGYGAVLVVALYLSSDEVRALYGHPTRMWLMCPLILYWISRVLLLSNRNEMHDDPVVFALTDRVSWYVAAAAGVVIAIST
ncbi:UbiA family prenyltransferase [uncultured Sphingomonas sp.]|uniref:UbiA family prenyltransferase n=1 Tax=uncultured Sphingomonas sp. TaxID=158754 RepID=UPI0035C9A6BE